MGHDALIADLRHKSSERIKKIRQEAEDQAEELRGRKKEELRKRRREIQAQLKDESQKIAAPILHEAERTALAVEDEAMGRLSERLYALAVDMLDQVRGRDYRLVFAQFVGEVPAIAWEMVQVSRQDRELAEAFFPGADIEVDSSIIGGFRASADGKRYRVVNTLEKRLEKGWPAILPILLRQIAREQDAGPAA
ncbi:MAG: V-type ATP synthase subunit E [Desulfobulbaceae bacterium]|nr:V-type ATP synthase subunit E [Desulfobulbaceae bacterium]